MRTLEEHAERAETVDDIRGNLQLINMALGVYGADGVEALCICVDAYDAMKADRDEWKRRAIEGAEKAVAHDEDCDDCTDVLVYCPHGAMEPDWYDAETEESE